MPWKECHVMDERLRFVARLLEGEEMPPQCAAADSYSTMLIVRPRSSPKAVPRRTASRLPALRLERR